jgi:7-cyano-7-deazaguanine synthase
MSKQKAIILLSGGLDSATALAIATEQGYGCYGLSFNYGQRSQTELDAAKNIAKMYAVIEHKILDFDLGMFGGSALTDNDIAIPESIEEGIPVTYVPARNTIFLSLALGWAEVLDAKRIFVGVNSVDYSGYPDCRPEYIKAFQAMADLATKAGVEGHGVQIETPLMDLTKSEIIHQGMNLGVEYQHTVSCYQADSEGRACAVCDSCRLRKKGFEDAGVDDPTRYQ